MQVLAPAAMETAPWRSGGCWRQCQLPSWYLHQPGAAFFVLAVLTCPLQICVFIYVFPYSHSRSAQVNHLRESEGIDRFFWSLQCSGTPELGVFHGNPTPAPGMCSHHLPAGGLGFWHRKHKILESQGREQQPGQELQLCSCWSSTHPLLALGVRWDFLL